MRQKFLCLGLSGVQLYCCMAPKVEHVTIYNQQMSHILEIIRKKWVFEKTSFFFLNYGSVGNTFYFILFCSNLNTSLLCDILLTRFRALISRPQSYVYGSVAAEKVVCWDPSRSRECLAYFLCRTNTRFYTSWFLFVQILSKCLASVEHLDASLQQGLGLP